MINEISGFKSLNQLLQQQKSLFLLTVVVLPHMDDPSKYSSIAYYRTEEGSTTQDRGTLSLLHNFARIADGCDVDKLTIEMLPEEILLQIFAFYMCGAYNDYRWKTLVHVCRKWRSIVFAAPCRLNLRVVCTGATPVGEMLDVWPTLPIAVEVNGKSDKINDNVLAALEKRDRIREVVIDDVSAGEIEELAGAMQVTFPALTDLWIYSLEDTAFFPETFLGGSAPNLQLLHFKCIAFPALPKLLLSSPGLVSLSLYDIPHSGYISSDAIVDCLSSLTRLEYLQLNFQSFQPPPDRTSRRQPPPTPTVFPVLSEILLDGVTEDLDQILAHIEAPLLDFVEIGFSDLPIFDISRIAQYIGRTEPFKAFDHAYMFFRNLGFDVALSSQKGTTVREVLTVSLAWKDSSWKLRDLILDSMDEFFEPFDLCNLERSSRPSWVKNITNAPWLHLLRFLAATEYIYLSEGIAVHVAPALQELTGARATEVLPILRNIFVRRLDSLGPVEEAIGQFVAERQLLSGHAIDVQCWARGENRQSGRR